MTNEHRSINIDLALLGGCEVRFNDSDATHLSSKAKALLVYLAMNDSQQRRTHIANLIWSELNESQALANLRKIIHEIKNTSTGSSSIVEACRHTIQLSPEHKFHVDAVKFESRLKENNIFTSELESLIKQYKGDFLSGFYIRSAQEFEAWRGAVAIRLHNQYTQALQEVSDKYKSTGDFSSATATLEKLLRLEPLREDFHLSLMQLYCKQGLRTNAMQQYEACKDILNTELSTEPLSELTNFYNTLQSNELPLSPTAVAVSHARDNYKFIVGPPVGSPELFFGREAYLSRIFGWWQRPPFGHVAIIGQRRSGKTSLLQHLRPISGLFETTRSSKQKTLWLDDAQAYRWIFIDFQDPRMRSLPSLLSFLLSQLGITPPESCTLESFMDLATAKPWTTPTLILMDELEAGLTADELDQPFWWALRALTQMTDGMIGIAVASHEQPMKLANSLDKSSPFFNIFTTLELGPFENAEALEFIESIDQPYTPEEIQWVFQHSGCWPCLMQVLCQEKYLAKKNGGDKWRENALRQLQNYAYLLQQK